MALSSRRERRSDIHVGPFFNPYREAQFLGCLTGSRTWARETARLSIRNSYIALWRDQQRYNGIWSYPFRGAM